MKFEVREGRGEMKEGKEGERAGERREKRGEGERGREKRSAGGEGRREENCSCNHIAGLLKLHCDTCAVITVFFPPLLVCI